MEWNNYEDSVFFCEWKVSEENENDCINTLKKAIKRDVKDASRYAKVRTGNIRKEIRDDFRDFGKPLRYSDNSLTEEKNEINL